MVGPSHGTISLAFIQTLGSSFVPDLISDFQKEFPNIQFQLSQNISKKILKEIEAANILTLVSVRRWNLMKVCVPFQFCLKNYS